MKCKVSASQRTVIVCDTVDIYGSHILLLEVALDVFERFDFLSLLIPTVIQQVYRRRTRTRVSAKQRLASRARRSRGYRRPVETIPHFTARSQSVRGLRQGRRQEAHRQPGRRHERDEGQRGSGAASVRRGLQCRRSRVRGPGVVGVLCRAPTGPPRRAQRAHGLLLVWQRGYRCAPRESQVRLGASRGCGLVRKRELLVRVRM